jgi:hypothetical protein
METSVIGGGIGKQFHLVTIFAARPMTQSKLQARMRGYANYESLARISIGFDPRSGY